MNVLSFEFAKLKTQNDSKLCYDGKAENADVAELVDAPDLGSGFARSEGSSPFIRIKLVCEALLRNCDCNHKLSDLDSLWLQNYLDKLCLQFFSVKIYSKPSSCRTDSSAVATVGSRKYAGFLRCWVT
jgi:hypothetical protein